LLSQVIRNGSFDEDDVVWVDVNPLTTISSILTAVSRVVELPRLTSITTFLQAAGMLDFPEIVSRIEANSICLVFDNVNSASENIGNFIEQLFVSSKHVLSASRVIFCSAELPSWHSPIDEAQGHLAVFELSGLRLEEVEAEFDIGVPSDELRTVHTATGGHPMALRLLEQLTEEEAGPSIDYRELRQKSISAIRDYLLRKIILKLSVRDQHHLSHLTVFNYNFSPAEAGIVIDGLTPRFELSNLIHKGILHFKDNTFSIHDALRAVAQTMIAARAAAELHWKLGEWYQTQVLDEFDEQKSASYELGFKWAYHIDSAHDLGRSTPRLSSYFSLSDDAIAALWDIERYGYPSDYNDADLHYSAALIAKLRKARLIRKRRRGDQDDGLYQVMSDDILSSMFVAYRCIKHNISGHMGYVPICKPNYAFLVQHRVLCHWEHVIEHLPFGPMTKDDEIGDYIEEFSNHPFVENLQNQLKTLQTLQTLRGKKLTKRRLRQVDFGGCPIFGHICPGGVGQAEYCRSIAHVIDFHRGGGDLRSPLDYLISAKRPPTDAE
jgi:hypothetical protein